MNIPTIDVDKVKELLDLYWKKWEPFEHEEVTGVYIQLSKEDFLYRINLYNDLIQRDDLSHFYPFRTILEILAKYEKLLTLSSKEREHWLHLDLSEEWRKISKESLEDNDTDSLAINNALNELERLFTGSSVKRQMNVKDVLSNSKIVHSKYTYNIYRAMSEYIHGSLFSASMRQHGNDKYMSMEFSRIILDILEKLGTTEEKSKTENVM